MQSKSTGGEPAAGAVPPLSGDTQTPRGVYEVGANDPEGQLIDLSGTTEADMGQINDIMRAMGELREAEDRLSEASMEYMKLGKTDMRALHFLIVSENLDQVVTATVLAHHLGITSASTTKLLDRLERGGHITRRPHPADRRSASVHITPETRAAAMDTVGKQQARRFNAAARLTPQEREVVARFLRDTAKELRDSLDDVAHDPQR